MCVCGVNYSPLIVIMCDICVKQTYQNDSRIHIIKNITSDHPAVVPLTAECNHGILLALSVYAKIVLLLTVDKKADVSFDAFQFF